MAKISLKKYGYLDSANKVHSLINELKTKNVRLTAELKARIVGKMQSKEAWACWNNRFGELEVLETNRDLANNLISTNGQTKGRSKRNRGNRKKRSNMLINNRRKLDPNSANYNVELLKTGLRDKFKEYDYDLSDW
jgi:hypothetical protein